MAYTIEQLVGAWNIQTEKAQEIADKAAELGISLDGRDGVKKLASIKRDIDKANNPNYGNSGKTRSVYVALDDDQSKAVAGKLGLDIVPVALAGSPEQGFRIKDASGFIYTKVDGQWIKKTVATVSPEERAQAKIQAFLGV